MKVQIQNVTPDQAKKWLDESEFDNRNIRLSNVEKISRALKNGNWVSDGTPIRFDINGDLIDGQHRLLAIIRSGKNAETVVVSGLKPEAKNTIDTGSSRTASDVLHFNGYSSTSRLAAICRLHMGWLSHNGDLLEFLRSSNNRSVSTQEILDIAQTYPYLQECCNIDKKYKAVTALVMPAAVNYAYFLISRNEGASDFFDKFNSGASLSEGSPILALRNSLLGKKATNHGTRDSVYSLAMIIKAWNLYVRGKTAQRIIFRAESESFPAVISV